MIVMKKSNNNTGCVEMSKKKHKPIKCPYCHENAVKAFGDEVYPHRNDLHHKKFWVCHGCDAYVGCHGTTFRPLGRLANAELRKAKIAAHIAFDTIWMGGYMPRSDAYVWLAGEMELSKSKCHIGEMTVSQCEAVVSICKRYRDSFLMC